MRGYTRGYIMPMFDVRCNEEGCEHRWETSKTYDAVALCPVCYSSNTTTLMPRMKGIKAKDPFDLVGPGARIPDSKPIKSFAHDRRKGGKDR
jgi:hypothetical protein